MSLFGGPELEEWQCGAELYLGDDHGDNTTTMRCQRAKRHHGMHEEVFERHYNQTVSTRWIVDELVYFAMRYLTDYYFDLCCPCEEITPVYTTDGTEEIVWLSCERCYREVENL